jgi:hypothetical protein
MKWNFHTLANTFPTHAYNEWTCTYITIVFIKILVVAIKYYYIIKERRHPKTCTIYIWLAGCFLDTWIPLSIITNTTVLVVPSNILKINATLYPSYNYSSMVLQPVLGEQPPWFCQGVETVKFLQGKNVSLTHNLQPEGPGYLSLSNNLPKPCLAWVTLPAARLPPE